MPINTKSTILKLENSRKNVKNSIFVYTEHAEFQKASFNSNWDVKQWNKMFWIDTFNSPSTFLIVFWVFLSTEQQNTDYLHTYSTSEEEYSVHIWVSTHIVLLYKCIHQKVKSAFKGAEKSRYNLDNNILNTHSYWE